jgi:hypothetical protein
MNTLHNTLPDERIDQHLKTFFKAAVPAMWPSCPRSMARPAQTGFWSASVRRRLALAASIVLLFLAQMWLGTTFVATERSSVSPNSPTEAHRRPHRPGGRIHNPPPNLDDRIERLTFPDGPRGRTDNPPSKSDKRR